MIVFLVKEWLRSLFQRKPKPKKEPSEFEKRKMMKEARINYLKNLGYILCYRCGGDKALKRTPSGKYICREGCK